MAFHLPRWRHSKARKQLSPCCKCSRNKESCLPAWNNASLLPLQIPVTRNSSRMTPPPLISLGASASSLLSELCFPTPMSPWPASYCRGYGWGTGVGSRGSSGGKPRGGSGVAHQGGGLGTTVSLVQALGLGLRESAPPDTLVVIYAERDTQLGQGLHQACSFSYSHRAHLGYRLQLIPVAAILCYTPSSTV